MRRRITMAACAGLVLAGWMLARAQAPPAPKGVKVVTATIEETRRKALVGRLAGGVPAGLKLTLNITGPLAKKAIRYGHVAVDEAVDDRGNRLEKVRLMFDRRQREGFLPVNTWKRRAVKDGFQLELYLAESKRSATKITRLKGSLKLLTGEKTVGVLIKNVKGLVGKQLDNKTLAKAGVTLAFVKTPTDLMTEPARQVSYTVGGNEAALLDVSLVDASGKRIAGTAGWMSQRTGRKIHFLSGLKELPDGVGVKLSVLIGAKVTTVPIVLKDIPLP